MTRYRTILIVALAFCHVACEAQEDTLNTEPHETTLAAATETPIPTTTNTQPPTATLLPQPTSTPRPQFNGYWLSPIDEGTSAYIQTYGNLCPEHIDGSDPNCIENYMGEKGTYPQDYWEILVCPHHIYEWDIAWDHQGENVYAVQGGKVSEVTLEDNSTIGVHFVIIDIKPDNWYGANYGHVNVHSLVENGIISQERAEQILAGEVVDGAWVWEGQLLGVTGDDCPGCAPGGILHIGPVYGGFEGTDPSELWEVGEWPDVRDDRPSEAGNPCPPATTPY